jgi:mono/diheme cytochrome c family protein
MKSRLLIIFAALAFLVSACTISLAEDITPPPNYQSPTPGPTMSPLFPQSAPNLASGALVYTEKCAPCHGPTGLGDGPMAAQLQKMPVAIGKSEKGRRAAPANWFTTVTQGNINSFMPPFNASLSDQQRWDVVAYAISLGGSTQKEASNGQSIYETNCVQCHGPSGNAIQGADFTDQALMAKLTQSDIANFVNKGVGSMPGFGGLISDEDIFAAAAFVRSFSVIPGDAAAVMVPSVTPQAVIANPTPEGTPAAPDATAQAPVTSAPTEVVGSISGKVTNGSAGTIPAETKIVLHVFEHDTATQNFSEVSTQETVIAADGTYKFDKITMTASRAFFVSMDYSNTKYESDPVFPKEGETSLDLPLTIYETTTDASGLQVDQAHILLDYSKPDVVQVVEFLIFNNPGTKSVVAAAKGGPVVSITLPKGYTNLQFDQGAIGERYVKTDEGFADTTSVSPGKNKYQLVFAVDIPLPKAGLFGGRKLEVVQPFPFKISAFSVLAPEGVTVEGEGLTAGGLQDMGTSAKYQVFNGGSIEPGKIMKFTSSGGIQSAATPAATGSNPTQSIIIGVGVFGLVLILAGGWMYLRDRKRAQNDDDEEDDDIDDGDGDELTSSEEIMDAIMALDDQFKSGNIQEAAYKERRAELKARLKGTTD